MERDADYIAVGSFVLLVLVMGILFVYWYSGAGRHQSYRRYEIYFDANINGLAEGSTVRYLGVDVGRVQRIGIDPRDPDRVQVIAAVDTSAPISPSTVAELSLQGVTGVLYVDLRSRNPGESGAQLLEVPSEHYPVIPSVRSGFNRFLNALPELTDRLNGLAQRAELVLSDQNIASVRRLLDNLAAATAGLPSSARDLDALVKQLSATTAAAHAVVGEIHTATLATSVNLVAAVRQLRTASAHLASASAQLDAFIGENRAPLTRFMQRGLPQIEALVRESRTTAQQISALARSLRQNPSRLIYQPPPSGVAIPR